MKMENVGAISEVEWNNYGGIYSSSNNEEADFMAQLLLDNENPNNSMFLGSCNNSSNDNTNNDNDVTNNMFFYFSNNSNNYNSSGHNNEIIYPIRSDESFVFEGGNNSKDDNFVESGDNFLVQELSNDSSKGDEDVDDHHQNGYYLGISLQLGMEHDHHQLDLPLHHHSQDEKLRCPKDNVPNKKRPPPHGYKNKRNVKPRKNQRAALLSSGNIGENENDSNNNNNNSALVLQRENSSMSYLSEDDTNASLESNGGGTTTTTTTTSSTSERGGATNQINGKTRASRGSATDPQSLYARKRREKINERLRILQNLVPNGTKVDISTMLEEAVQYVKFLQLQIKLLSSDDLWMYSPIAYNGMDMGLDLKIASHDL